MNRRTSGPLVVSSMLLLAGPAAMAQTFVEEDLCSNPRVTCITLSNEELRGVFGFEEEERTDTGELIFPGTVGRRMVPRNLAVANILSQLDIDGDGVPDLSPDTDGDGLPDNWEVGGFEALTAEGESIDRVVFYPAPSAIVPGTPPTPIFTRLAVGTSALDPDTDGDGLSDFVEVFGLAFIDEDKDGILEGGREWNDKNGDGLPSPGEFPLDNSIEFEPVTSNLLHDFDGFVFTDPTNPDTDGDGEPDGEDPDPLINLRAFGNTAITLVRFGAEGNRDIDQDGLGNAMDMGNDLVTSDCENLDPCDIPEDIEAIDNPANVGDLISLFREDLEAAGVVPEAAIEDLLGADWDGNGLWRITDVRTWHIVIDETDEPPAVDFMLGERELYADQTFEDIAALYNDPGYDRYGDRGVGLGWQDLLRPTGRTQFIPDRRVWAILYSWRMPGFDIDGDGFVGVPNISSTAAAADDSENASVALENGVLTEQAPRRRECAPGENPATCVPLQDAFDPFDDRIEIGEAEGGGGGIDDDNLPDGRIEPPNIAIPCGPIGAFMILCMFAGLMAMRPVAFGSPRS